MWWPSPSLLLLCLSPALAVTARLGQGLWQGAAVCQPKLLPRVPSELLALCRGLEEEE